MRLILASQSPRRAQLVRLLGVKRIEIKSSNVDENVEEITTPEAFVMQLALRKAREVSKNIANEAIILGADTTVVLDGNILEKPLDAEDAVKMLTKLSGRTHTVYTGCALIESATGREDSFVEHTDVTFRTLHLAEIVAYVATGAPLDKAGAYGIQEDFGAVFVSRIDGDYYNVVGLPLCSLYVRLKAFAPALFAEA